MPLVKLLVVIALSAILLTGGCGRAPAVIELEGRGFISGSSYPFSLDGNKVLTVSKDDNIVRIWNAATGKELQDPPRKQTWEELEKQEQKFKGLRDGDREAISSPDGKKVLTYDGVTLQILDAATEKELQKFEGIHGVRLAIFSSDGKKVLAAGYDQTVRIWDAATGKELHRLNGYSASFSPDGEKVLTSSNDDTVRIWDLKKVEQAIIRKRP